MTWTPIITASSFTGVNTDLGVAVAGIMGLMLVVFGVAVIMRIIGR